MDRNTPGRSAVVRSTPVAFVGLYKEKNPLITLSEISANHQDPHLRAQAASDQDI